MLWNIGSGLVHGAFQPKSSPGLAGLHYPAVWKARSGFLDCDVNLHLNNSSYLFGMELARWHFTASNGVLWQTLKHRRMFLVASQAIRYRHGIPPFHAYEIKSQMIYWDGPWIYFLQQFHDPSSGKLFAEGLCRAVVKQRGEDVTFAQLIAEVYDGPVPDQPAEMPDVVKGFLEWDAASRSSMEVTQARETKIINSNPPPPKPQSLGARIWTEVLRSMNRPY
uniref:Thioesterase domain-containing protein n=1 Tax=Hyaloperonospora arabidopsidis (strain Emoy2) TaxID=559515 RepID=M4BZT2_HYAAE